jgi:diacylglycerol kinase family enzyme
MSDGALDVVFFPCASCMAGLLWMIRTRLRRHVHSAPVVYRKGRDILVRSVPARPYQIDGDPAGPAAGISELSITVRSATLPVLVPPQSRRT